MLLSLTGENNFDLECVWVVQFIATLMLQRNYKGLIMYIWVSLYYCICHFPLAPCVRCSFYSKPKVNFVQGYNQTAHSRKY